MWQSGSGNQMSKSLIETLRAEPDFKQRIATLSDEELEFLAYDWKSWARPGQLPPDKPFTYWMAMAGRGWGKTRVGAETVRMWVKDFSRVNIIVRTKGDIEKVVINSKGGILNVCPPHERPVWIGNKNLFRWPNGATSFIFTAEEPDALRGPEHEKLWCDELAAWRYDQEAWDMAQLGLRIGSNPQAVITTTPRPTKLVRSILANAATVLTRGTTYENRANLAAAFYNTIITKYEGTRLGRQELNAEVLDDNPGALWKRSNFDANRVRVSPPLVRIIVGVDPAVSSNPDSDETGILIVGKDNRYPPHFYVLDDSSGIYTPDEWGAMAVGRYAFYQADRIVGEGNNGGDLVESNIRHQNADVAYTKVTASRGKFVRAEPIAAIYEQNRVHHVGNFSELEDQCCDFNPADDSQKYSPDRMDALVWAMTELTGTNDAFSEYAKAQVRENVSSRIIEASTPFIAGMLGVGGEDSRRCECGSTVWMEFRGQQICFRCQKGRPK
jgi:phage terminase large subunit-like protein